MRLAARKTPNHATKLSTGTTFVRAAGLGHSFPLLAFFLHLANKAASLALSQPFIN